MMQAQFAPKMQPSLGSTSTDNPLQMQPIASAMSSLQSSVTALEQRFSSLLEQLECISKQSVTGNSCNKEQQPISCELEGRIRELDSRIYAVALRITEAREALCL